MRSTRRFLFWLCGITIVHPFLPAAWGHFGILVPVQPAERRGEPVVLRYYTGHPFECELTDTPAPAKAQVILPDGKTRVDLKVEAQQVDDFTGGQVTVQTLTFTPTERGDHLVVVTSPLAFDEHAGGFVQDELKVLVRVQVQKGWDNPAGQRIELLPLTRPYGLRPGFAFKAQARLNGKPIADAEVEIEKLNPTPPEIIPEDDALVTQTVKTDVNGYVVCTLAEPGWWGMMVTAEDGRQERDGKQWPIIRRAIMWVYVDEVRSEK
jgi:cobalt/nickel transport protein